jgi:predicted phosphohydrolase
MDKPMDVFGEKWYKHDENIKNNWLRLISPEDTVLIAGDISWSMNMEEGIKELAWIHELPGEKMLIKGNHDYWWNSITKLNKMYEDMHFIQNNFFEYKDIAICGTRGWICPHSDNFVSKDQKIYERELIRLRLSLEAAKNSGHKRIFSMIHYPPTNDKNVETGFTELFNEFNVEKIIYGHLHNNFQSKIQNEKYILTSCDFIDFTPIKLEE